MFDHKITTPVVDGERVTMFFDRKGRKHVAPPLPWIWADPELAGVLSWPDGRILVDQLKPVHVLRLLWHALKWGFSEAGTPSLSPEHVGALFLAGDLVGPLKVLTSVISTSHEVAETQTETADVAGVQVTSPIAP